MSELSQKAELMSNASGLQISSNVITVTPELAKKWLEGMVQNQRPAAEPTILKYSRAMVRDKWRLAAPLSFASNGQLIDGQHRLLAVIKANKPVDFIVLRGLDSTAIEALDMGLNRTSAHLAKLQGLPLTNKHLALLNCCFFSPVGKATISLSKQEQVEMGKIHFEALDFALRGKKDGANVDYAPYLAPIARAYYCENHERLKEFLQVLHSGFSVSKDPSEDSAALALRNLHFKNRYASVRRTGGIDVRIQGFKIASNALTSFILRKPIKILRESNFNHFPVKDFDAWWKEKIAA